MAAVPENRRIAELRRLGVSEPLVRLASGDCVHRMFRHSCLGPPYYFYHMAGTRAGPPLAPLWDCNDTALGVWERADGPEFIEFSIEAEDEDEYTPLARTEQGFWATQFDFYYGGEIPDEEVREAAAAVGFQFLDRLVAAREAAGSQLSTFEGHQAWLRELVAGIDREWLGRTAIWPQKSIGAPSNSEDA
jgi:hypothetical protein